jgi:hypothetical protein
MKAAVYSKSPIISAEDVKSMFSIVEVITKINREFLDTLVCVFVCFLCFCTFFIQKFQLFLRRFVRMFVLCVFYVVCVFVLCCAFVWV